MTLTRTMPGQRVAVLALVLTAVSLTGYAAEPSGPYDLWIRNGRVCDGTGAAPVEADVLVRDERIVRIGSVSGVTAKRVIDATDKVVAPGFIDAHSHGDPLSDASFANFATQGVTSVVLGQDGSSPGYPDDRAGKARYSLVRWMAAVDKAQLQTNVVTLVGHGTLRSMAGVGTAAQPTSPQMDAMQKMLRDGLDAGAFGMSSGLEYVPGRYAHRDELIALADTVGRAGGVVMSHMRSEDSDKVLDALDELIAQSGRARVHVSHLKVVFAHEAQEGDRVLQLLESARQRGVAVTADVYPYLAGYGDLSLVYPPWAKTRAEWEQAVATNRAGLEAYLRERIELRGGAKAILFAQAPYTNMTLAQLAERSKLPPEKVVIDVIGFGGPSAAHFNMRQDVQDRFVAWQHASISTDGGPTLHHPRSWGTYPKILQEYVRDRQVLTLERAIRKMSGLPADIVGLQARGELKPGYYADIVIFSPATVRSNATWEKPAQPASGIDVVIVNGCVTAENGRMTPQHCGRLLRKPHAASDQPTALVRLD
jgi:N-acyl-D-amino-acid deacylase